MRTVLVTGASAGIGKATAERLLQEGYTVYVAARRVEKMRSLELRGAMALEMDVTKEEDIVAAVERITAERGGVDVLINNAGFATYGAVEDTSLADARYQFEVNLFGLARLTQEVLPYMRAQGAGTIVNLSSMGGRIYTPLGAWYHATKHALEGWSDCLRIELKAHGIHVVIIEPGTIESEFRDVMMGPMLARSGEGPYADLAQGLAQTSRRTRGSPPSVVARAITRALKAKHPRPRYVAGHLARPLMWTRKWLGDRVFDRLLLTMV